MQALEGKGVMASFLEIVLMYLLRLALEGVFTCLDVVVILSVMGVCVKVALIYPCVSTVKGVSGGKGVI